MPAATVPSTPTPGSAVLISTFVRACLMIAGPWLATHGISVDEGTAGVIETGAGSVLTLGGVAWSFWQKYHQAQLDHAGNVASAVAGEPVKAVEP